MARYFWIGIMNAASLVLGLWVGITLTEVRLAREPQIVYREVLPSPVVYWEGKRSEPGEMSPETINAIEIQTARELFSGKMRDPFRKVKKDKPPRQVCLEE